MHATTEDDVVYGHPEEMRYRKAYLALLEKGVESGLSWVGAVDGNYIIVGIRAKAHHVM